MKSKTIIISSPDAESKRGILTITEETDLLRCKLRLYNVDKLSASCHLGLYHNEQVYTANLINRGSYYESSFVGNFDMSLDFYSAIIDTSQDNQVILAGGTYAGFYYDDSSVFSNTQPIAEKDEIEELIDNEIIKAESCQDCDKCAKCKYKEFFYSQSPTPTTNNTPEPKTEPIAEPTNKLLSSLIPQFEYIFENYAENTELTTLIRNSKFVTIKDEREYSIGAIYEDNQIAYICYAVRCNYNTPAPEELGKHYQWLPLDAQDPLSEGYYIVYQDALDLKIVEL